jgi:hypothetical protein
MTEKTHDQKPFDRRVFDKSYPTEAAKREYDRHLSELEYAVCGKAGGSCGCKWDGKKERFVKK